jgi:alanine racemase
LRTEAIIRLDSLRRNIQTARRKIGSLPKICMPVKADAYGHGAVPVSRAALEAGVEYLGIAAVAEGKELRDAKIKAPIIIFSQISAEDLSGAIAMNLIPMVSDEEFIETAAQAAKKARKQLTVHLKIDTGMGRLGCEPEEAAALAKKIAAAENLTLGGVATHLAVSDSLTPKNVTYTKEQIKKFSEAVAAIKDAGVEPGIVHAANSGALVFHEDAYFDMVRPGIFLYGYPPAAKGDKGLAAEPVMEVKSVVTNIKKVNKGETVSYGRTWKAAHDTHVGIIPIGYGDGFSRLLSNDYYVLIKGETYPIVGRICMDQCMIDLGSELKVKRWDEVLIFGQGFTNAAGVAERLNTIPYEITCNISRRVPRKYIS